MSRLSAFLHPAASAEQREVVISKRFVDENGKPVPFTIRAVSQEENEALTKRSKRTRTVKGVTQEYVDAQEHARRLVVAATVEPDFSSAELCESFGVMDPLLVPGKMLLAGEYAALSRAILELSGFDGPGLEEEAKN